MSRRHVYHFDSADRLSHSSASNPKFNIDDNFRVRTPRMHVESVTIPYTFYTVDSTNDTIFYNEDGATTTNSMTITHGVYTSTTFASTLQTLWTTDATATVTVTESTVTNKFTIASDGATFQILLSGTTARYLLGLSADKTGATSYVMDNVFDMTGGRHNIYVHSDLTRAFYSSIHTSETSVMAIVPVNASTGSILHHHSNTEQEFPLSSFPRSQITFELKDRFDNTIDLQGLNWSITLIVEEGQDNNSSSGGFSDNGGRLNPMAKAFQPRPVQLTQPVQRRGQVQIAEQ